MREYKFRAWDKEENKWAWYGNTGHDLNIISEDCLCGGDESFFIIMQYTGLKDKNGKEIYEGDIVRTWIEDELGSIEISFESGCYCAKEGIELYTFNTDCEIIGNIYENPEL